MKWLMAGLLAFVLATAGAGADVGSAADAAEAILERVQANRPAKDFSLKARLFVSRDPPVFVDILVKNTREEMRTIYRAGGMSLMVVQPGRGEARFFLAGEGELTGDRRTGRLLGSVFTYYDLGVPFLRWPRPKLLGEERHRGRDCYLVESASPGGEPYARVKMWIDREYFALLRAEAFDENGDLIRRFAITSFKKIDEVWVPRAMEVAFVPPGQSLPAQEKSRLEIFEGNYDAQLPAEWFQQDQFVGP